MKLKINTSQVTMRMWVGDAFLALGIVSLSSKADIGHGRTLSTEVINA